jgi:hypothetical protein
LRTPHAIVALRSVSGGNSIVFYTEPGVLSLDDPDADFVALICRHPEVFVVTRARDGETLVRSATAHGRRAVLLATSANDALVRVDGPACARVR